ncbi:hypothetical protein RGQ29_031172 [Quercus rubra]|uniref:RecF/RecN/SMC N-terminal domain-containing protein n=1 Tax=Quercus rubra TaxID=3512 RepID=A0AAN7IBL3_QUERU|nr:hypothetical protein RGQ29_031172 [Quercus rubra]
MPSLPCPGRIHCLELENFKSYKGFQTIGPFYDFTAIVGPNGSGKSNLMDAISFVLGVRAGQLRGAQLKDLIYAFDDEEKEQKGRRASVRLVYQFANSSELHFTRTITSSGGSEYRIDGTTVPGTSTMPSLGILEFSSRLAISSSFRVMWSPLHPKIPKNLLHLLSRYLGLMNSRESMRNVKKKKLGLKNNQHLLIRRKEH